jgi:hypothetical protein
MLARLSLKQLIEWIAYFELEPRESKRADYRAASVVAAVYNVNRDTKKRRSPYKITDFVLQFSEGDEQPKKKMQSWQQQKAIGYQMFQASQKNRT